MSIRKEIEFVVFQMSRLGAVSYLFRLRAHRRHW
jgi:hypothetical protein